MSAELHAFLAPDHERLDALLDTCLRTCDAEAYEAFRRGLLRHISIEERVLFPLLRTHDGRRRWKSTSTATRPRSPRC